VALDYNDQVEEAGRELPVSIGVLIIIGYALIKCPGSSKLVFFCKPYIVWYGR